ncbi:peptidylprolyl isomerase [Sphingomonas sp. SUN019]|uniref:peptidylprolyl isomerase n=1 Tax=Sphingomonas sp. SUN019 TaxID=2937788 RepID=UPI00216477FC|nr:peptidylprolyl isomerase [Sphingomonas sp. SUN019]UVO50093.1 peptidylprolyl isomerase [Sphingomonas sp. SUN019]
MAQVPAPAPPPPAAPLAPSEIVAAAPAADWTPIAAGDLLVMDLAPGANGAPRRVVIQLMPAPFSEGWVGNIRKLAAAHWWDGTSVNRVQDNYVAQWGDATEKKALPGGLAVPTEDDYVVRREFGSPRSPVTRALGPGNDVNSYATVYKGFPLQTMGTPDSVTSWPVHCYGMVGVGRNLSPDTGSGAELYTVIGHAPRHLDRNIALVGRVVEGIEHLSSLPRGTEALGFYKTAAERTPILRVRMAGELPVSERPRFEYLSTESATFARYAEARANRRDAFFIRPAGGADVCNVPVPVRRAKQAR